MASDNFEATFIVMPAIPVKVECEEITRWPCGPDEIRRAASLVADTTAPRLMQSSASGGVTGGAAGYVLADAVELVAIFHIAFGFWSSVLCGLPDRS
ncbi:MAG: hypothetical protein ABWY12_01110 [Burkholderiales bacterium]